LLFVVVVVLISGSIDSLWVWLISIMINNMVVVAT
jgi:hypothetical protein